MRRAAAILAAVLLALTASGQGSPPSAEESWAAWLLVLGGVAGVIALIVGGRAAWRIVSAPIQTLDRLEQIVIRPVEGSTGLVERVGRIEATMASADDLDALRLTIDAEAKARTNDNAVMMALLKEIRGAVRHPGSHPDDSDG